MGIHNERGSRKIKPQPSTAGLIAEMLAALLDTTDKERNYLQKSPINYISEVVLLINNLGGLSVLEISSLTNIVLEHLQIRYSIWQCRVYAGTFLSSLNGPGFSITLLSLPTDEPAVAQKASRILACLDAPTSAVGWGQSPPTARWLETSPKTRIIEGRNNRVEKVEIKSIPCELMAIGLFIIEIANGIYRQRGFAHFDPDVGKGINNER